MMLPVRAHEPNLGGDRVDRALRRPGARAARSPSVIVGVQDALDSLPQQPPARAVDHVAQGPVHLDEGAVRALQSHADRGRLERHPHAPLADRLGVLGDSQLGHVGGH